MTIYCNLGNTSVKNNLQCFPINFSRYECKDMERQVLEYFDQKDMLHCIHSFADNGFTQC